MTNFFSAVIERVLPSVPAVSPRREVRFQPAPVAHENSPEPAPDVAYERPRPQPPRHVPELPKLPAVPAMTARAPVEIDEPQVRPRQPVRRQEEVRVMKADPRQEPLVQPRSLRAQRLTSHIVPISEETTRPSERPVAVPRKDSKAPEKRPESKVVPIPPKQVESHRNPPIPLPSIVPSVQRVSREPAAPREITAKRNDPESKASSPPRIEITIGTVEVRAMVATPTAVPVQRAPQREPAPAVSLTEYLKQRGNSRA